MKNQQEKPSSPFPAPSGTLGELIARRRSVRAYSDSPIPIESVKRILVAGQGVTSADGKRSTPSAHALYPLRLYLLARRIDQLDCGFYTFDSTVPAIIRNHASIPPGALLATSLAEDHWLEEAPAVVIIAASRQSAIDHFSGQQADGLRGVRYVDFEAGAAAQNMALAAVQEGLGSVVVMGIDDLKLKAALPVPPHVHPIALFCLGAIEHSPESQRVD